MKKWMLFIALLLYSGIPWAQSYTPIDAESKVAFIIKNFGIKVDGSLKGIKGDILFNPGALNTSSFNVSVNAATIDTDNSARDKHLKKAEYFDTEKFPLITIASSKISKAGTQDLYKMMGNLTIKGITLPIELNFTATPLAKGYRFKTSFTINRRDFKVGGKSLPLSDNVTVNLDVVAYQ